MTEEEDEERYARAVHAMQSGVAMEMNNSEVHSTEPKHLRVGINAAMCDHAALVRLLVEKGVITGPEYKKAIADEMEREVERYEKRLRGPLKTKIKLG